MKSQGWLRFKIVTSFLIAGLGVVMIARLANMVPLTPGSLLWFLVPVVLVVASVWRGLIFVRAVRGLTEP